MKELFFSLIGAELLPEGFVRKGNKFSKTADGNEYVYHVDGSDRFLSFESGFLILIGEVETVKKLAWGKGYKKYASVGNSKRYLLPKEKRDQCWSWSDTEEAVRLAVKNEMAFYQEFVRDYFKQYSQIPFLDSCLNDSPYEHRILTFNQVQTSFLAIIVAYLNTNPELPALLPFYRAIVDKFNKHYLEEFDLLEKHVLSQ